MTSTDPHRERWNERYASAELVWGAEPNRFVAEELGSVAPRGRALDLACGEGRNAIWLATRGWQVTGVDFSRVGLERARKLADERSVVVEWVEADVTRWEPDAGAFALVLVLYVQLPPAGRRRLLARAARALAPHGALLMIGHARRNLGKGWGGPQDPEVLWEAAEIVAELEALGLTRLQSEDLDRSVDTPEGVRYAIDLRVRAQRPG